MPESGTNAERLARFDRWFDRPRAVAPRSSYDGRSTYVISDRGGLPQAWVIRRDGGEPELFVGGTERVGQVDPRPDGPEVVVAVDRGGNEHWELRLVAEDGRLLRPLTSDPRTIHSSGAWAGARDYAFSSNARDPRFFDVWTVPVAGGPPRLVRQEDSWLDVAGADADRLLLVRRTTNVDRDVLLRSGSSELRLNPHDGEQAVFDVVLGPDAVYGAANPDREFAGIVRWGLAGGTELLHEFPGDVEALAIVRDRLAVAVNEDGWSTLRLVDLATNEVTPVELPEPGVVTSLKARPDGSELLFDLSSLAAGTEVYGVRPEDRRVRRLTTSPGPPPGPAFRPTLRRFDASDRLRVPYWVYQPRGPPKGTLVYVHGGPEAQARPSFLPVFGFLLDEGFRVVAPNVRGSSGYGRTYLHLDDVRRRPDSVRDLAELVAALRSPTAGLALPAGERIGVLGGSYGGFMVLASVSSYPELFDAAVDVVGIANFVTFLRETGAWRRKLREDEYGSLERDLEFLRELSPLYRADRIRTPLLVVHGDNDPRVPVHEAEQIVRALEARNVPVEFLRFPNEGHGLVRRENQRVAYVRAAEFLLRYLEGGP